jgi:hypothetical protein
MRASFIACLVVMVLAPSGWAQFHIEQRNEVSYLRGPYILDFYHRHNDAFRSGAAIHFAHGKQHDTLLSTPLRDSQWVDQRTDREFVNFLLNRTARTEPEMFLYAPSTGQAMWRLYRAIDWTHMHHEQTYDVLSSRNVPWARKKEFTDRSVRYYLEKNEVARSPAPLDVTMRRAAVMMKPYFAFFRNYYPRSTQFFFAAHWWHPAVYEAQMLGGQAGQEPYVQEVERILRQEVLTDRPEAMLLSREIMPRYSQLSPESANIFDNLHMLHGIAYDILAYEGWSVEEKRKELYRVIDAMSYHPGDEELAAKFQLPYPDVNPLVYEPWMRGTEVEMNRIMHEMMEEMMPMMMPQGMEEPMRARMMEQFQMKLRPGMQDGEMEGSLHDALMALMPDMRMDPASTAPGGTPHPMVEAMMKGWQQKYGDLPNIAPHYQESNPDKKPLRPRNNR